VEGCREQPYKRLSCPMNSKKPRIPRLTFRVAAGTAARQSCSPRRHGEVSYPFLLPRYGWVFLRRKKGIAKREASMVHVAGDAVLYSVTCSVALTTSDLVLLTQQQDETRSSI
jgi:hypothetical protein